MTEVKSFAGFEVCCGTDIGLQRTENQDNYGFFDTLNGFVFVVCDGMGGHAGGAEASEIAVNGINVFLSNYYFKNPKDALIQAIIYANNLIYATATENKNLYGMGSTIVLGILRKNQFFYAHVGDSRIYLFSQKKFSCLTKDHSYVQGLIDNNLITAEEAANHPRSNELAKALGVDDSVEPSVCESPVELSKGDMLLLSTDGLTSYVNGEVIENYINKPDKIDSKVANLIKASNDTGGHDNITVQIINYLADNLIVVNKNVDFIQDNKKYLIFSLSLFLFVMAYILSTQKSNNFSIVNEEERRQHDTLISSNESTRDTILLYIIKKNDNLNDIVERFSLDADQLALLNKVDSVVIRQGYILRIPLKAIHTVESGDNLSVLEEIYKTPKELIMKANELNSIDLRSGQKLYIPKIKKEN